MMKWIMKGSCKDRWIKGLGKSMDHRKVMGKICRIMDEGWRDGGMWECFGMEGNHDQ